MSKFFAGGASDSSDISSSEEEDLYLSEQSDVSEDLSDSASEHSDNDSEGDSDSDDSSGGAQQFIRNKFLKGQGSDSDDSDSDDDRGAIKSAKDKLIDEVNAGVKAFDSAAASEDWVEASSAFDKAFRIQERAMRVYSVVPLSIVKLLTTTEKTLAPARGKKLSPSNTKAVNAVSQRSKKFAKEYSQRVEKYLEDPENYNPEPPTVTELQSARGTPQPSDETEYTSATLFTTLSSITEARGKKKTDRAEQISILEKLLKVAETPYQLISVLLILVPVRFDVQQGGMLPEETWKAIEANTRQLFDVLEKNPEYIVIESAKEPEDIDSPPAPGPDGTRQLLGSVSSLVERLDDEHLKALQVIDPHTTEYIDRLRHQTKMYDLFLRAQAHLEHNLERLGRDVNGNQALCRLLVRRLDHIYYKPSEAIVAAELSAWAAVPEQLNSKITPRISSAPADKKAYTIELIDSISKALYNQPNTVFRSKAMLALIYHYALNDEYFKARDLMLMSHLQSNIQNAEPAVRVMFNRALVQVGLCAFRCDLYQDSLQALQDICSSSRIKEPLGQALAKFPTGNAPDRAQILPFHMHINVELIECVYLTSSLLIETPQSTCTRPTADKKKSNHSPNPIRRMLDFHDRQVLSGPSENTRDHIIQAARAVQLGDWQQATTLLCSIKVWSLLSNTDKILAQIKQKLQEESLCLYLLTYCSCYDSLSLEYLTEQFALPLDKVSSLITKLIANNELHAKFDDSDKYVLFPESADPTKLEILGASLVEKVATMTERNERLAGDGHESKKHHHLRSRRQPPVKTA